MRPSGKITVGLTAIILVVVVGIALLSTGTLLGSRTSTITQTVSANSTQTQTIFSTRNDTTTTTSTQTSTEVSTSTSYSTESTTVMTTITTTVTTLPVLSKDPSVVLASTKLVIITPAWPIYNVTLVNEGSEPVTNVSMVFENTTFYSHITSQNPLLAGQSTMLNFTYKATSGQPEYFALLYGTFQNGQPFAYIESFKLS
jgi:hypothetical protein